MRLLPAVLSGLLSQVTIAICIQAAPSSLSVQPYANLSIDGWTLIDGGAGSGSDKRGFGLFDLGANFVITDNLEGHIGGFLYSGDRNVDGFTGDFGVYSNIITDTQYNVFTAWIQYSLGHSYLRFGQLASDENFYVSEGGSLFLNSNFGALPSVSANVAAPIFSVGSAGAEYRNDFESGYFQMGAYAGNPGPSGRDDHGFKWKGGGDAGYFYIAEREWQLSKISSFEANIKVGAYYHSGRFDSFTNESYSKGNSAFYAVIDHSLSESVSLFGRFGINPNSEYSVIEQYVDIGFNWQGVINNRPRDVFGIAYSHSQFGSEFSDSIVIEENRSIADEQVIEVTYQVMIASDWQIQPSLQYILNPLNAIEDTLVAGIRLTVEY